MHVLCATHTNKVALSLSYFMLDRSDGLLELLDYTCTRNMLYVADSAYCALDAKRTFARKTMHAGCIQMLDEHARARSWFSAIPVGNYDRRAIIRIFSTEGLH